MRKAYVSSTFEDLKEYRQIVGLALRRAGLLDVAMEYYVAEDKRALDRCLADVKSCDIYICILGWRYGWKPPNEKLSITELEYRCATNAKKPCLVFLVDPKAPWPPAAIDSNRAAIDRFRKLVSKEHIASFFASPDSLFGQVVLAVQRHLESQLQSNQFDVAAYVRYLRRRYALLDVDSLVDPRRDDSHWLRLDTVFVEPTLHELSAAPLIETAAGANTWRSSNAEDDVGSVSRKAIRLLSEPENRLIVLLGDAGSGKSSLLRYLAISAMTNESASSESSAGRLPVLIDLRSYARVRSSTENRTIFEYFDWLHRSEGCPISGTSLAEYLATNQPALVMFDGLDEVLALEERDAIVRQIAAFAERYEHAVVVVASRIVGYRRKILTESGFKHVEIQPFDRMQMHALVQRWYTVTLPTTEGVGDATSRIMNSVDSSPSMRELARNPLLLTVLLIITRRHELPRDRWQLYDHSVNVLLEYWDTYKHLDMRQLEFLDGEARKALLREVALAIQNNEQAVTPNAISSDALQQLTERFLTMRYALSVDRAAKVARQLIYELETRNYILVRLGSGIFGFVHRAYLEFFSASALVERFEKSRELSLGQLKELFNRHRADAYWTETLRLTCSAIDESFAGEIIDELRNNADLDSLRLAVECLSDIRRIDRIHDSVGRLLTKVAEVLVNRPNDATPQQISTLLGAVISVGDRWPARERILAASLTADISATEQKWATELLVAAAHATVPLAPADSAVLPITEKKRNRRRRPLSEKTKE